MCVCDYLLRRGAKPEPVAQKTQPRARARQRVRHGASARPATMGRSKKSFRKRSEAKFNGVDASTLGGRGFLDKSQNKLVRETRGGRVQNNYLHAVLFGVFAVIVAAWALGY